MKVGVFYKLEADYHDKGKFVLLISERCLRQNIEDLVHVYCSILKRNPGRYYNAYRDVLQPIEPRQS